MTVYCSENQLEIALASAKAYCLASMSLSKPQKRRTVSLATFKKWKRDFDRDYHTLTWLDCVTALDHGNKVVERLQCSVCTKFQDRIMGRKNFSNKWTAAVGAESVRTSTLRDHAGTDQHAHAMMLLNREKSKAQGLTVSSYAPIARALHKLSNEERARLRRKFDIAYFVATEKLSFLKYSRICELEKKHGVDLGTSYVNEHAGRTFIHYIAEARKEELIDLLRKADFFSILLDGSTDKGNIDNELMMVVWCDINAEDEKVHTRISYFRPESVRAEGLFQVLESGLERVGISEISPDLCKKLVGIGTDGASANIAASGLKGLVETKLDWIFWMWCLAHRLELAIKDALSGTSFDLIDEMLLRLYYLYEKSPKKCRELAEIVADLKEFLSFDDGGVRPIRSCGSRWVTHKLNAMKRVLAKFGAFTHHILALSEDSSVKGGDRAKLKGYLTKWINGKYILGCAVFVDLLLPCAIFSKVMQSDEIDILGALNSLLKTVQETEKLASRPLNQWPTFSATLKKFTEEDGIKSYQCQEVKLLSQAEVFYETHYPDYCSRVVQCIKTRLAWSDLQLMRDLVFFLSTHGWEKVLVDEDITDDSTAIMEPISRLVERFKIPLEGAGTDTDLICDEFRDMLQYAIQYISVATLDYRSIWWRLFHAPTACDWSNVLKLAELVFSLPASNGKLERVFSVVTTIKTKNRTLLNNQSLDDLLVLNSDAVPLSDFCGDAGIDLWWAAATRRPNQKPRRPYKKRKSNAGTAITDHDDDSHSSQSESGPQSEPGTSNTASAAESSHIDDTDSSEIGESESECDLSEWDAFI